MKRWRTAWILLVFYIIGISCSLIPGNGTSKGENVSSDGVYQNHGFSFHIPEGWSIHEGSSVQGKNGWNYFQLGLNILVEIKGSKWQPSVAITDRDIPAGSSFADVFEETYKDPLPSINKVIDFENVSIDGLPALSKQYNRPWGEPWYTFKDTWVEKNGRIYVINCLVSLNHPEYFQQGCEEIIKSFHFLDNSPSENPGTPLPASEGSNNSLPAGGCPENKGKLVYAYNLREEDGAVNYRLVISDADGSNRRELPQQNSHVNTMPAWSPERCRIAFSSYTPDGKEDIFTIHADGTSLQRLTDDPANDIFPDWSPDGKQIAFVSYKDGIRNLYIVDADGGTPRQITFNPGEYSQWLMFSPVDNSLLYNYNPGKDTPGEGIYLIQADGSGNTQLTFPEGDDGDLDAAWSADGKKIYFISNRSSHMEIWEINNDGTGIKQISNLHGKGIFIDHSLRASPDGKYLVFYGAGPEGVDFSTDLFRINIDGSGLTNITRSKGAEEWVDW